MKEIIIRAHIGNEPIRRAHATIHISIPAIVITDRNFETNSFQEQTKLFNDTCEVDAENIVHALTETLPQKTLNLIREYLKELPF